MALATTGSVEDHKYANLGQMPRRSDRALTDRTRRGAHHDGRWRGTDQRALTRCGQGGGSSGQVAWLRRARGGSGPLGNARSHVVGVCGHRETAGCSARPPPRRRTTTSTRTPVVPGCGGRGAVRTRWPCPGSPSRASPPPTRRRAGSVTTPVARVAPPPWQTQVTGRKTEDGARRCRRRAPLFI